ncbi:MAG: hypothetical protein GY796_29950 [Chloroflexi bacterium]|nr:hypothetical protein [Chloroflexota bacterium]
MNTHLKQNKPLRHFSLAILSIFLLLGFSSTLYASTNNTWTFVGDLQTPRAYHSATTFNDNQVLVAGGDMDGTILNSAETFDLNTSLWTLTASMNQARKNHADVLLDDGTVLVAGGIGATSELVSAEIYDPVSASWTVVASMNQSRVNAIVTKLQDGRVLVSGGTAGGVGLTSAEIYDPVTDIWAPTGAMPSDAVHTNAGVLLNDGRVFIKGHAGFINEGVGTLPAEESPTKLPQIYDPQTNTWSEGSPMNTLKLGGTSILLDNGNVLVVGGETFLHDYWGFPYFTCDAPSEIYNPNTDTWTVTGALNTSLLNPSKVALLPDGSVLAFGPSAFDFDHFSACGFDNGETEIYDPITGSWSVTDTAITDRNFGGAFASLADGKVLTIGGGSLPEIVEIFTPSGDSPISPPRSEVLHIGDIDGESVELNNPPYYGWSAIATFTVLDQNDQPVQGAEVSSFSSTGQTSPDVCTTDALGQCSVGHNKQSFSYNDRIIWVTDVTLPLTTYDPAANTDPDGDSDGTTIVIPRGDGPDIPDPTTVHVSDLDGSSVFVTNSRWRATTSITIVDQDGVVQSNATISGNWSGGTSGSGSCTTDGNGNCQIESNRIRKKFSSATFTVTNVVKSDFDYDSLLNSDPDGDSNGTAITILKP